MSPAVRTFLSKHAFYVAMAAVVTFVVYRTAWISDDATITFRYVSNLRHGHGAVFNVGERVQGYTHPLWFLALAAATVFTGDEVYAAFGLGIGLTFATAVVLASRLSNAGRAATDGVTGPVVTALVLTVLASSDSWRAFQTSGLEGSLSTFLLVLFATSVLDERSSRAPAVLLSASLLVLCRPDFAVLVTPGCAIVAASAMRERRWRGAAAALTPLLGFVVSRVYYGDFLPNTGAAKLGVYTVPQGIQHGLWYVADWLKNEPVTVLAAVALLAYGAVRLRKRAIVALWAGVIAYCAYVVFVGGDFMRGRLLVPVLVGSVTIGGMALARTWKREWQPGAVVAAAAGVVLLGAAALRLAPAQEKVVENGIVNERLFYVPSHSLATYRETRRLAHNEQFDIVAAYLKACGSVTVHSTNPGALGYYLGPELTVIDVLGLTDRFVARLPKENIIEADPRPGHPYKFIPKAYLARRGDVALLPAWEDDMRKLDCSLKERVKALESDTSMFRP